MVWNVACYAAPLFTAYVPISGGFWNSNPDTCSSGPVNMRYIHGLSDTVVAFDDIGIYNSMPIPEGMAILREVNQCPAEPNATRSHSRYECKEWSRCTTEGQLQLCLHSRGHSIQAEWVADGYDWMLSLGE